MRERAGKSWGYALIDGKIQYLNTDLVLSSTDDLNGLASNLNEGGVQPLSVVQGEDGLWYANFETHESFDEPETNIAAIVAVIEVLDDPLRQVWANCSLREFNIGYDCGDEPWSFNQGISSSLLTRMGAVNASLRVTIYPDKGQRSGASSADHSVEE